jgi:hypothetical protein
MERSWMRLKIGFFVAFCLASIPSAALSSSSILKSDIQPEEVRISFANYRTDWHHRCVEEAFTVTSAEHDSLFSSGTRVRCAPKDSVQFLTNMECPVGWERRAPAVPPHPEGWRHACYWMADLPLMQVQSTAPCPAGFFVEDEKASFRAKRCIRDQKIARELVEKIRCRRAGEGRVHKLGDKRFYQGGLLCAEGATRFLAQVLCTMNGEKVGPGFLADCWQARAAKELEQIKNKSAPAGPLAELEGIGVEVWFYVERREKESATLVHNGRVLQLYRSDFDRSEWDRMRQGRTQAFLLRESVFLHVQKKLVDAPYLNPLQRGRVLAP